MRAREKHSHYLETAPLFHFVVKFVLLSYNIKVHNGSMKVCNDNVQVHNIIKVPDDDVKSTQWWYDILLNIYIYYILHNIIYYNDTYKIAQSKCKSAWQWSFWHSIQLSTVFPQLFFIVSFHIVYCRWDIVLHQQLFAKMVLKLLPTSPPPPPPPQSTELKSMHIKSTITWGWDRPSLQLESLRSPMRPETFQWTNSVYSLHRL